MKVTAIHAAVGAALAGSFAHPPRVLAQEGGLEEIVVTATPPSGGYTLSVFGTNVTAEYMMTSGFFHGIWGYNFATVSRPREFGASFQFRFAGSGR
jgi:hypothetical protein